jgi:hypothetical protein
MRVLRRAIPKPRPPPTPRRRFLHTPSLLDAVAASPSPSPNLFSRSSGSLPPSTAGAIAEAAPTAAESAAAYLLELAEAALPAAQVLAALLSAW